jgi:alpha-beta hydrolase superfamily lysophospholipase
VTSPEHEVLTASDGHEIRTQIWRPAGPATHVIQILHGLGEHADRYARFATAATARGCVVYCHDHRGHGRNADQLGHFDNNDGWALVIGDVHIVHQHIVDKYPTLPLTLLGHSMGSYIGQSFVIRHSVRLDSLILSASTWPSRTQVLLALILAKLEVWRLGADHNSAILNRLGFGDFNKAFHPAKTASDWLSRDEAEVDRYVSDPLCGGPYSASLWADLTAGLLEISSDKALRQIAFDLPILIAGGELDPVGGDKGMTKLAMHYAQTGHQRLTVKIYPGGRHEMLNETVRDDVTHDWLEWLLATSRNARSD